MTKVKSLEELKKLREAFQQQIKIRHQGDTSESKTQIRVAMATCGIASGAKAVMEYFIEELDKRNVDAVVMQTGCMGYCYAEPTVEITKPGEEPIVFGWVDEKKPMQLLKNT